VLTKRCCIPHASRQLAQETTKQVKTVILQQGWQLRFHKQEQKINHEAGVGRRSRTKASSLIRLIKNHSKILKLVQFEKFLLINPHF